MKNLRLHAAMLCLVAVLLATALLLAGCPAETPAGGTSSTVTTTGSSQSSKLTYTVTVLDADGNPIAGVEVQICDGDRCLLPNVTGEDGTVSFKTTSGNFKAQIKDAPEGYTYEAEYPFPAGETSLTITLTAA